MILEDFKKLTHYEQEDYLNGGGTLDASSAIEQQSPKAEVTHDTSNIQPKNIIDSSKTIDNIPSSLMGAQPELILQPSSFLLSKFDGFMLQNPLELLLMIDENISSGRVQLHRWQIEFLTDFSIGGIDDKNPFQSVVRACNGSGKDKYIIAPCIVWMCMRWKETIGVVTSSSGAQLDHQTCRYIKQFCEGVNRTIGNAIGCPQLWKCNYREYKLDFKDGAISQIYCYATDEPRKAEGYHPTEFGAKMGIFVSEDKTVPDDINVAINKCTGYTHRVHVSTPGLPMGHFYDYCSLSINRRSINNINEVSPTDWIEYHIKASDCSHISVNYLKQMERDLPGGKFGAAYKSQVDAEFATTDEMVVIPYTYIWKAIRSTSIQHLPEAFNTAGLDLSDGGAETVLVIRNGNKLTKVIPFKFDNTEDTIAFLVEKFKEFNLNNSESWINADCVGMGKPMLDRMKRMGWKNIRYVDSRNSAQYSKTYKNRATELFFHMRQLLEREEIILVNDDILVRQLSTRYYKLVGGSIHQLLSKIEQRSKGYPSPDRADAVNLAFWDYQSTWVEKEITDDNRPFTITELSKPKSSFDLRLTNSKPKWIANDGQKDFSSLREELEDYNRQLQLSKN